MASRAYSLVRRILGPDDAISWRLEFNLTRNLAPLRLQKWRVVGDGRTTREQMLEYATTFQASHSEEGENTPVPTSRPSKESIPSSSLTMVEEGEDCGHCQSPSTRDSLTAEAETMPGHSPARSASPSIGSEFNYADGYISGQEEIESKEALIDDDDNVELTVTEAHSFKVFRTDDEEKREPVSITDLDFEYRVGDPSNVRLHMMGFCSNDSSGLFMLTIDSWTIKQDGERSLRMYVRDTKGSWIKLCNPSKGYEGSVEDALILSSFLELAMNLKTTNPKSFVDQVVIKSRSSKDGIKRVLLKYYDSVVKKFVQLPSAPRSLQRSPIIKDMEAVLKAEVQKAQNVPTLKASLSKRRRVVESDPENGSDEEEEGIENLAQPTPNKRKRVVESDPEDESDSEDHVPLAQRNFQFSRRSASKSVSPDGQGENAVNRDEYEMEFESRKQDHGNGASVDLPLSPASSKDDGRSRWSKEDIDYKGEPEFQDIADIYGGQTDGLCDIGDDDNDELGDSAFCAICDDGGDLLFCDGPCMRSFHASKQAAANSSESKCRSLGYTVEEVQEMGSWYCPNCVENQHQCFICGRLGRSDGKDKEVFVCDVALCGRFYHPHCLAKWKGFEKDRIQRVKEGVEEFCCPAHKCRKCGEGEKEGGDDNSNKLAKCRRCPKAYHKVCLPKWISFESRGDEPIRAWEIGDEDDPVKRLVIYCLDHDIVEHLSTPERNHLKWPKDTFLPRKKAQEAGFIPNKLLSQPVGKHQKLLKGSSSRQKTANNDVEIIEHSFALDLNHSRRANVSLKQKVVQEDSNIDKPNPLMKPHTGLGSFIATGKDRRSSVPEVQAVVPSVKHIHPLKRKELHKKNVDAHLIVKEVHIAKEGQEKRIEQYLKQASQSVTLETVKKDLVQPSCYGENRKKNFIHRGELMSILNAAKKAWEKVKNGGSIDDAKRLCPKDLFVQMLKTEDMLRVHLAPFLHGMRYTSFGRHFTCVNKLKEIVDRIHPYIDNGDMVVDFCCGANDFSILLNEKLLSVGKTCHFKNFDIHPPKNGFCFTKGDWLENEGRGFFEGKKLIMGLNPPFGVRAALANKFIIHALTFRPKLLVLIVPPETMSFSTGYKDYNYDLVWEDKELLAGHAFYLPGSVDDNENENMTQWNVVPPPLYLWSSGDMIKKHKEIALRLKHVEGLQADATGLPHRRTPTPSPPAGEISRIKTPSDNRTNSGSTPIECDTSSSRPQLSSASSSLADGISQNSLDRPGPGHATGVHKGAVQNSYPGHGSGGLSSGHHAPLQKFSNRTGIQPGSAAGHNPFPAAGPPHDNHNRDFPRQHHKAGPRHSNLEVLPMTPGHLDHAGPPFTDSRGMVTMAASELHVNCVNPNLTQVTRDHHSQYCYNDKIAHTTPPCNGDQVDRTSQRPIWYKNPLPVHHRPLLSLPSRPDIPAFPNVNGVSQQFIANQGFPQAWQGPPPGLAMLHPHIVPGHIVPGLPGFRYEGPSSAPRQDMYLRGMHPQYERRPGGGPHDIDNGSGGWLNG